MREKESDSRNQSLYEQLKIYGDSDYYPFHMPGHKRNPEFLDFGWAVTMDITEIDGFDNMHRPEGIIRKAQQRAAMLYGADETFFLVNGSSAGIISAILGSCRRGERILAARNCHKSVYHAIEMGGLKPVYIYPSVQQPLGVYGSVSAVSVDRALKAYPDIAAVVITSPTYEGVISDIRGIAEVVHRYGIPLIVDEAHGAHLGFAPGFGQTAVRLGADIVIQSVHKTLPSLTQTALMHFKGRLVRRAQVMKYYSYIQTTSPSYLMMASIDHCMNLLEKEGKKLFDKYRQRLTEFLNQCRHLKHLRILDRQSFDTEQAYDFDMSKIVIYVSPVRACGKWLYDILLNKYHLQMEMASRDYVIAMTSICDTEEGFRRLYQALEEIDGMDMSALSAYPVYTQEDASWIPVQEDASGICENGSGHCRLNDAACACLEPLLTPYEASLKKTKTVALKAAAGKISGEYAYVYPPGIPFLVPGEKITEKHLEKMKNYTLEGFTIEGVSDESLSSLNILDV